MRVGVFPLVNRSGNFLAEEKVMGALILNLLKSGRFELADSLAVEEFLERERIRRTDMISTSMARKLKEEFGIEAVIIGSVELYESGKDPKVGISLLMVNLTTEGIVWSRSASSTLEDFTGIFGLRRVSSALELTHIIVEEMVASMPGRFTNGSFRRKPHL